MKQPVTELDPRFSERDAVATDWGETRAALEEAELFWISTRPADGRPHVTPLVGVWLDDAIYVATGPGEQKAVNLRTNQNVILTTGCNQWERGLDAGTTRCTTAASGTRVEAARPRVLGQARQGAGVRQGHLRPDASPVLGTSALNVRFPTATGQPDPRRLMISGYPLVPRMNRNGRPVAIAACFAFVLRVRDDREVAATTSQES